MEAPVLHLIQPSEWRAALTAGVVTPPSLDEVGFVHMSAPEQVHLPANRLFAGRRDLMTLVVDPRRVGAEIRWEPGVPGDPASMRFPHLYGPLPTSAAVAVLPYPPDDDGVFAAPPIGPVDDAWRSLTFEVSMLRRTATATVEVPGGVVVLTASVPGSRFHNQPFFTGPVDADTVVAETDRVLAGAGLEHRTAALLGAANAATAAELGRRGWLVETLVHLVARAGGTPDGRAEPVGPAALRAFWEATWRRSVPDLPADHLRQLVDRNALQEAVTDVRYLAVRESGEIVAAVRLTIDGATGWVDALDTAPGHRRRGHGDALLHAAVATAAAAGCDIVSLTADAADRPYAWYSRRGFTEVARSWTVDRNRPGSGGRAAERGRATG